MYSLQNKSGAAQRNVTRVRACSSCAYVCTADTRSLRKFVLLLAKRVHPQRVLLAPHSSVRCRTQYSLIEVMQFKLQEFVQNRTVEQIVVPVGHGVEVYLLPKERIQERIVEQVVDIPLPQIMEEMLFSSTYALESYGRTDRGRLHSPDSGGNFRVGVIRHAFHLEQILRAHATRSQVSSSFSLLSWGRAVRRTLKPVTPLEPLMESSRSAVTVLLADFS